MANIIWLIIICIILFIISWCSLAVSCREENKKQEPLLPDV